MVMRFDDLGAKPAAPKANNEVPPRPGTMFSDLGSGGVEGTDRKYDDWGSWAVDFARSAGGQGALLGFGDELVAGVRSLISGRPYEDLKAEERDAVDRFRKQNPKTAFAGELAGGLATPGLGAGRFIAQAATLPGKMARAVPVGAGFAGVGGVGASESEDPRDWMTAAKEGAVTGAVVAPAIPAAGRVLGNMLQRGDTAAQSAINSERAAQLYLADRLKGAGVEPGAMAADLARGQAARKFSGGLAELPETIADLNPTAQRVLRGIKVGGEADNTIEPFLAKRQAGEIDFTKGAEAGGQGSRLAEDLRLSLRLSQKELADKLDAITGKRSKEAETLFSAARKGSEPFDLSRTLEIYNLRAMNMADPQQRAVLQRAIQFFDQAGTAGMKKGGSFAVDDVERFHQAKMALDDLIGRAEIAEQGNLKRLLTGLKHDLMDDVFVPTTKGDPTRNLKYREALDKYASRSELLNAAEMGRDFATGRLQVTDRMFRGLSEGEKAMFRAAWQHVQTQKMGDKAAGPTTDFTQSLRKPSVGDDLRMILPPTAGKSAEFPGGNREKLTELVKREARMSDTARKVLGNSSTAEKAADAIDIGRLARVTRYIKDTGGLVQAAAASLSDALEKMSAIKGERARYLAQKLLSTNPDEQQAFLAQIEKTYGSNVARKINGAFNDWLLRFEASFAGGTGRQTEEKRTK